MDKQILADEFDQLLSGVTDEARDEYVEKSADLIRYVNRAVERRKDIGDLLGGQSPQTLRENHENHVYFMGSVFALRSGASLVETILWVYRAYPGRGVALEYFPIALEAWRNGVQSFMGPQNGPCIEAVYEKMLQSHSYFIELAIPEAGPDHMDSAYKDVIEEFLTYLLEPNMKKSVELASKNIKDAQDVGIWWNNVITPSMRRIGELWEDGKISVGQEHLATSITQRVMSLFYNKILELPRDRGTVVLAATPGELHEIGPRMVSDLLEIEGWDVHFTGANTPTDSLLSLVKTHRAKYLLLSTTLISHMQKVLDLIKLVKRADLGTKPKILVGGQAYSMDPNVWQTVCADAVADSPRSAIDTLEQWAAG